MNFETKNNEINSELKRYIETEIFPLYERNEKAHGIRTYLHSYQSKFKYRKKI